MSMLANHHESVLILTELTSVFTDEKDAQAITDINEKEKLFFDRHDAKQMEMKKTIKALTADLSIIESKAQRKEPKKRYEANRVAKKKEEELVKSRLEQHELNLKKLDEELDRIIKMEETIKARSAAIARGEEELPRLQYLLGLYRALSHIEWTDHHPSSDANIEGHVTSTSDVLPFHLDATISTKTTVVNQLWDMFGSS